MRLPARLLCAALCVVPWALAENVVSGAPDNAQLGRALVALRADPNLATEKTVRALHWVDSQQEAEHPPSGLLVWLAGLFAWFAQTTRVVVWVAVAVLAAILVAYLANLWRTRREALGSEVARAPSHVRDLDIRPESLPADIGAAARRLWECGEQRAALALLYRGLLSRLVNLHGVPVRDSSTEGECLALVMRRLDADRSGYAAQLIRTWQLAVYGGRTPAATAVLSLCDGFAAALDAAAQPV